MEGKCAFLLQTLKCNFTQAPHHLLGSALQPGHLELCFKAHFLTAHDLFPRTTCAWPLSICRFGCVCYEHLAVLVNQMTVSEGKNLSLPLFLKRGLIPSQTVDGGCGREKEQGLSSLGPAVHPGDLGFGSTA